MKKIYMILAAITLLSMSLNAQMTLTKAPNRADRATTVTLDFSTNNWGFPEGNSNKTTAERTYTYGGYSITLEGGGSGNGHYYNASDHYLLMGKSGATLTFPAFDKKVKQIQVVGRSAASSSVVQNIYVGSTAVSTATTGATGTNTYVIDANYQTIGTIYILKVTSSHNTQITSITITFESENAELSLPASVNVGTNTGNGVSTTVNIKGSNLTQDLTVSVSGTGFSIDRDVTVTAAEANSTNGQNINVYYNGTDATATGSLRIYSSEVDETVALTANYVDPSTSTTYEKVTSSSQLEAGQQYILVCEDKNLALTSTATGNFLAGEAVTISSSTVLVGSSSSIAQFTLGGSVGAWKLALGSNYLNASSGSTNLKINSTATEWTITNDNGGLSGFRVKHSDATRAVIYQKASNQFGNYSYSNVDGDNYSYAWLYVKKNNTTPTPELTSIANGDVINVGVNTGNGVSKTVNIKGNNLTQDLTVNVSGNGFSISRAVTVTAAEANSANGQDVIVTYNGTDANATGTLTVTSNEIGTVTAQLTASYSSTPVGETGTVGNGATSDFYLPAYGSYQDYGYKNQMIYTADKLAEAGIQAGDQITSITFYPTTASGYNGGIDFYGSTVTLSLGNTEVSSFSGSKITPSDLTDVVTITPVRDNNATEWTFSWSTPFTYTGENLLVQVYCPGYEHDGTNGDYGRTYFKGDNQSSNVGLYSYNSSSYSTSGTSGTSGTNRQFLPQATFTYLTNTNPVLTDPQDGDNVSLGTYEAPATNASTTITVKGRNLTEALSVSVSGTGFHVSTNSVSAADANAGTTITVTYDGTDPTATGTLTITSGNGEVSTVTVNLTSGYIAHNPVLTAPTSGTTIDVGNNTGAGTSTTVTVTGNYLTQDLNVSVSGTGFRVTPETLTAEDVNDGTATITITYTGTNPNASGTLTIASVNGEVSVTVPLSATYSTGIAPVVHGMVRMGTLPIVDQFVEEIPPTNDHPYRYTYYLKLATRDTTSSPARVPAQHTGAVIEGYYSQTQMDEDTDPDNFLPINMLSAEVDMNLSPASAPYFYTVNSALNAVPQHADDYSSYVNVLQRREAGDYQEMQTAYTYNDANIPNPNKYKIYESGENSLVDYRDIQAESHLDSLCYVPIVWTKGIDRYYYTSDSLHNSYGAPLWEVRIGRVEIQKPTYERQAKNANGDWNASVNWYDEDGNACSLFAIKSLHATGYLPISNIEYEPYMFRLWVECDGLRNMNQVPGTGAVNDTTSSLRKSPKLLYTKYCHGADDLYLDIDKDENNWDNNIYFGGLNTIKPKFIVRFYYTVKGHQKPLDAKSTRAEGDDEDHVGYVVQEEADPYDPSTVIYELKPTGEIVNQIFYNIQGMQSNKPFDGVNIVVTTYSDGSVTTTKVVR